MPMYMQRPGGIQPAYPIMPQMMGAPGRGAGRGGYPMMQQQGRGNYGMPGYGNMPQQGGRGGRVGQQGRGYPARGGRAQGQMQARGGVAGRGGQPGIKFNQQ